MSGLPALTSVGGSPVPAPVAAGTAGNLSAAARSVSPAASEPAFVRNGSAAVKSAYREALGFEEMLVEQLAQSMAKTGGLGEGGGLGESGEAGGEGEAESGGGASLLSSMLPQTLSQALTRGGGLGLASKLTTEIDPAALANPAALAGAKASS